MRIELIINSGNGEALSEIRGEVARLREASHHVRGRVTFEPGDAARFAQDAVVEGADLVISGGGDGTLNEVVNGMIGAAAGNPDRSLPRLGVIPLGTGNDFAAFIGAPNDIAAAIELAVSGPETRTDVAGVNGRLFLNVSSGGLGAEATEETSERSKRLLGSVAYLATGIRKFASLTPIEGRFTTGDETIFEGPFLFFAIGNGGRTGGGVWITPRADISDGLLDLCIVRDMAHGDFLRLLPGLRSGQHLSSEHVLYRKVSEVVVEPFGDLSVNVDGEPIEGSVLNYSIAPGALRVAGRPEMRPNAS